MIYEIERKTSGIKTRQWLGRLIRKICPTFSFFQCIVGIGGRYKVVSVMGKPLIVDLKDEGVAYYLYFNRIWEAEETKATLKLLKPGMVYVDIGANIGYFTVLAALSVGKQGKVIAFEPDEKNFKLLEKNVFANRFEKVVLENKAVSDTSSRADLYCSNIFYGDHRIYCPTDHSNRGNTQRLRRQVETIALDDYFKDGFDKIDMIKMDIQGAEHRALMGMRRTLNRNQAVIIMVEFWPQGLIQAGTLPQLFLDDVRKMGFNIYHLEHDCLFKISDETLLSKVTDHSQTNNFLSTNILLSRNEIAI